jgi:uncharacterized protein
MDRSRHQLDEQVWLDARRALWLPGESVLAVADLHLGYAWAQRRRGQLIPLSAPERTAQRLADLQQTYQPRQIAFLGDIVHEAVPLETVRSEVRLVCEALTSESELIWVAGNHDRGLDKLLEDCAISARVAREWQTGEFLLLHGDQPPSDPGAARGKRLILGHEHPAIRLGDGATTSEKFPCFLVSDSAIVLPAFSEWAAGSAIGARPFLSPIAGQARFRQAVAILGDRLLPIPLRH